MMNNTTAKCRNKDVSTLLFALLLGQVVSLALAILGFTSSLLANQGVHAPLTQSFFSYLTLALVYIPILLSRCRNLMVPWYWYALAGFVDSVGNYLITKAYQFSSITSVSLLACWTILWVIILTWIFIGTRYSIGQFVGSAVCIGGLALVFLLDAKESGSGGRNPILGDVLVLCGTIGFALSNVGEEFCVKKRDRVEYIAMLAVFGLIGTMSAISMFERENLQAIKWSPEIVSIFAAHAFSSLMFYTILPFVLKIGGSTLFNLSALTTNMWAVVIRLFFYHNKVERLYFLSFAVVTIGLIIYSVTEKDSGTATDMEVGESNIHYQVLAAENDEIMFASNDGRSEQRVLVT